MGKTNKKKRRKKARLKSLIFGRDNDSGSRNYKIRVAYIIKSGNAGIKPGIAVKSVGNFPEGIAVAYPVRNPFLGYYRRNFI
jgi:hypothetical protein